MLSHWNYIEKSLLLSGVAFISSFAFGVKEVKAEVPSCIELSSPKIGDTCYTEIGYNARVENQKSPQNFEHSHVAQSGYVIVDTRNFEEGRGGTTSGPNIIVTRPGTAIQILRNYKQANKELNDFYQNIEVKAKGKDINLNGLLNIKQRTEEQFGSPALMVISFAYLNNWSEAEII